MKDLIREQGSEGLVSRIGYDDGIKVVNDFDTKYPWSDMERITTPQGDQFIRVYKYYVHYTKNEKGLITGRELSLYKVGDDWDCFAFQDENGVDIPYIDIGCYLASVNTYGYMQSIPGVYPTRGLKLSAAQLAADLCNTYADGHKYQLFDFRCNQIEQDLFTVEFATTNSTGLMTGYNYGSYSGRNILNGQTDSIPSSTGTRNEVSATNGTFPMKYRNIENIVGAGHLVVDGIRFSGSTIKVCRAGMDPANEGSYIESTLKKPTVSGQVANLGYDEVNGLVYPQVIATAGDYTDTYTGGKDDNQILIRGISSSTGYGLYCYGNIGEAAVDTYAVYRLIRKPVQA